MANSNVFPKLNIAIVGAGIAGLATAVFLQRSGHSVRVFERFAAAKPVGSGIVIQPIGLNVLDKLGIGAELRDLGNPIQRILGHSNTWNWPVLDTHYRGTPALAVHRAALFGLLYRKVQEKSVPIKADCEIHNFKDRHLEARNKNLFGPFDLVIDASGARSQISQFDIKDLAYGALWATVNWVEGVVPADHLSQRYHRASKMAGILPLGRPSQGSSLKAALFWSLRLNDYEDWRNNDIEIWKKEVTTFWPQITPFIDQIQSHKDLACAQYGHGWHKKPMRDGLVHIGDACHHTSPQLGQGANMALVDALALSYSLEHLPLEQALQNYVTLRKRHLRLYQLTSSLLTPFYQSNSRALPIIRDWVLFPASRIPPIPRILSKLISGVLVAPIADPQILVPC